MFVLNMLFFWRYLVPEKFMVGGFLWHSFDEAHHTSGPFPYCRLVTEVREIEETMGQLRERLQAAEGALQTLVKTKVSLEHDISIKANSLFLDQEKCMGMRKTFPSTPRLVGYT